MDTTASYDVAYRQPRRPMSVSRHGQSVLRQLFNQPLQQVEGTATYAGERLTVDLKLRRRQGVEGSITGAMVVHRDRRALDLSSLTVTLLNTGWQLEPAAVPRTVTWDEAGIALPPLSFSNTANADARIALSGTWREDGKGALRITATHVFLDTFARPAEQPARYGGVIDLDATVRGTRDWPTVTSQLTVTNGRFRRFPYEKSAAWTTTTACWMSTCVSSHRGLADAPEYPWRFRSRAARKADEARRSIQRDRPRSP